MATPAPSRTFTPADVEAMDDPIAFELEDGHLVERQMGTESSEIGAMIIAVLQRYIWGQAPRSRFDLQRCSSHLP